VVLVGLLDEEGDTAVLRGDDTDGLLESTLVPQSLCPTVVFTLSAIWPSFWRL
jgi:hypothetical protein